MKKRKTLKWLMIFVGVLLVSLFFSRTVQTITTPKVQKISASRGRLEEKIPLTANLTFSQGEEVFMMDAKKLNIAITEVLAQQGYFVKKGDLLARADIPSLAGEKEKIQAEYDKAVRALGDATTANVRLAQDTPHNQVHEQYYTSLEDYYMKRLEAQTKASDIGYDIPEDILSWGREPANPEATPRPSWAKPTPEPVPLADMPDEMKAIMQEAFDLYRISEQNFTELKRIIGGQSKISRTPDGTFTHVKKIYESRMAIQAQTKAMLELETLAGGLTEIRAPHDGYLTTFTLKKGDSYDGAKALYTISREGEIPTLKADISQVQKTIEKGTKVEMEGIRADMAVSDIKVEAANKKFAIIELTDSLIFQLGGIGKLMATPPTVTLVYKSQRTTTLLPASAVRTDSDGSSFVYTIQQNWGGMLSNTNFVLKKMPVTILEKTSRLVAVSEEVSYMDIADKEDRAIREGQVVMEYVD